MRTLLFLLALNVAGFTAGRAAISVGAGGSGVISFDSRPPSGEWSTKSIPGLDTSFSSAADLLNAVQTNATAASISAPVLDGGGANPPGQNALAAWTSGGTSNLWTRPTGNGATLLMATLQNATGADQAALRIIYTLGQSAGGPAEQAPAHQVYYSLSGALGSWVNILALSGGGPGVRSNTVALSETWTNGSPLYVLWADDNAVGGVDHGYSIDDISFSFNTGAGPSLPTIPDFITDVREAVSLVVRGTNSAGTASGLTYSLDAAPATARIHAIKGFFLWRPERADAATTNVITVRVTDDHLPPSSATKTFIVVVRDYVELSLGSVVTETGRRTNVPVQFAATAPLTNLMFTVRLPTDRLTALALDNLVPSLASATLDVAQPGRALLTFAALPGQTLSGTQQLARLHFTVVAGQGSAFLPLQLSDVTGLRAQPGLAPGVLLNHGRGIAVEVQPLLEALNIGGARTLTLYGRAGTNYVIESAASPAGPWQLQYSVTLTNLLYSLDASAGTNAPAIFYRARE